MIVGEKRLPEFYNPYYMTAAAFASAVVIYAPEFFFRSQKEAVLVRFQTAIASAVLLNAAGSLGLYRLYRIGFEYDKWVHFFIPLILIFAIFDFLKSFGQSFKLSLGLAFFGVLAGGLAWEFVELFSDVFLGTETMGHYCYDISRDTIVDIIANGMGAAVAAFIIFLRKGKPIIRHPS